MFKNNIARILAGVMLAGSAGCRGYLSQGSTAGSLAPAGEQAGTAAVQKRGDLSVRPVTPPIFTYNVVAVWPHDPTAFTQGLVFRDGYLYEGTGLNGESSLRQVDLTSGRIIRKVNLARQYFGEGITVFGGRVFQLTWQTQRGFVYSFDNFEVLSDFAYTGEGWGLTDDGTSLIMSDGTNQLRFIDPATFQNTRLLSVQDGGRPIDRLNELEYVQGEIYANVWQTDRIACISPLNGAVVKWIDLTDLLPEEDRSRSVDVLNGIAYDAAGDRLFVTGKLWPKLFQIRLRRVQ